MRRQTPRTQAWDADHTGRVLTAQRTSHGSAEDVRGLKPAAVIDATRCQQPCVSAYPVDHKQRSTQLAERPSDKERALLFSAQRSSKDFYDLGRCVWLDVQTNQNGLK